MELYFQEHSNNGRPVALFDLDETLGDMVTNMIHHVNVNHGTSLVYSEIRSLVDFSSVLNTDFKGWLDLINRVSMEDLFEFYPNVRHFLNGVASGALLGTPFDIAIVTSRGNYWRNSVGLTIKSLEDNLIPYHSLAVLDFHTDKIAWAQEVFGDRLSHVFEDSPSNLKKAFDAGLTTYKNITPYNKDVKTHGFIDVPNGRAVLYDEFNQDSRHGLA